MRPLDDHVFTVFLSVSVEQFFQFFLLLSSPDRGQLLLGSVWGGGGGGGERERERERERLGTSLSASIHVNVHQNKPNIHCMHQQLVIYGIYYTPSAFDIYPRTVL